MHSSVHSEVFYRKYVYTYVCMKGSEVEVLTKLKRRTCNSNIARRRDICGPRDLEIGVTRGLRSAKSSGSPSGLGAAAGGDFVDDREAELGAGAEDVGLGGRVVLEGVGAPDDVDGV